MDRLHWQIGGLLLLIVIGYASSLRNQFLYDDRIFIGYEEGAAPFGWKAFLFGPSRPLTFLSFHLNYLAAGLAPVSWHAVNILLHAANAVLLLFVARRHLPPRLAFAAAAIFAVHPLNTEVASYVYQRSTALATLFALGAFLLFLQEQYSWSVGAFALSLLCKEETIALPAFLLIYDLLYRHRRPLLKYYAALLGIAGLFAVRAFYGWRLPTVSPTVGYRIRGVSMLSFALTEPRVVWAYLRLFLIPLGQNVDHDVVLSRGPFFPASTLPALLGLVAMVGLLGWFAWRRNQAAFWGLGFFILLAPTSSIVPVRDVMFEHRVYFPLICLVIAGAELLARMPHRAIAPVTAVILIPLLGLTIARNRVWRDAKSLWTDAAEKSPNKARPWGALGTLWVTEDPARARQYFERALVLKPDDASVQTGLGVTCLLTKDGPNAVAHFQQAIALGGATPENLTNLAMADHLLGRLGEAIGNYRLALTLDPCQKKARKNLAIALATQGRELEAAAARRSPDACSAE